MSKLDMDTREITNERDLMVYYLYIYLLNKDEETLKKVLFLSDIYTERKNLGRTK